MSTDGFGVSSEPLQRLRGSVRLAVRRRGDRSVVLRRYEAGSGRVRFPTTAPDDPPEAVIINLGGGMTDGDRFTVDLDLEPASELVATTQAAEKAYRSRGGLATVEVSAKLGPASSLHWLPQETIVYEGSRLRRELSVDLSADACFLGTETIILGRKASGEALHDAVLLDRCTIRRDGLLVWHDSLRLAGDLTSLADGTALLGGAAAIATVLVAAPGAESMVGTVREFLSDGVRAGVSTRSGIVVARFMATDGAALRSALAAFLLALRSALKGREVALPRVWSS